jgi:transketolase
MEGVSHEASALAGTWSLGKLLVFYDDNDISIDGNVAPWFNENVAQRYQAYGWHVIESIDGHDPDAINQAIEEAKQDPRPSLLCCKTIIGWGSPKLSGSAKSHGSPLGDEEIAHVRQHIGWPHAPFVIPETLYNSWDAKQKGQIQQNAWQTHYNNYQQAYPELAKALERRIRGDLPANFEKNQENWLKHAAQLKDMATRQSSQAWLQEAQADLPELIGGSADLSGSNGTLWKNASIQSPENPTGRYIHYGVREFGMTAIMNGISLYGGFIPYGGTFLVFSDYARNAVRLAALMKLRTILVYTHDSVALGEDGPTHQPIEHLAALRAIPNLNVWRPADAVETTAAWMTALQHQGPSALVLTRQTLPNLNIKHTANIQRGAHVVYSTSHSCDAIVIATGSEVHLATEAAKQLAKKSIQVQVVSMPCVKQFINQDKAYQDQVLRPDVVTRCVIEAASRDTWYRFVNHAEQIIGIDEFGVSAKGHDALKHFNITVTAIVDRVQLLLKNTVSMN